MELLLKYWREQKVKIKLNLIFLMLLVLVSRFAYSEITFSSKNIYVGKMKLFVEVAQTPEQQERGLMYRQKLSEGKGMLFVFKEEQPRVFWMKNTFVPLSIGFFNAKKNLIDIQDMEPVKSEMDTKVSTYTSAGPAKYALEVPVGWFARHDVTLGSKLKISK
jgi:uncharacterized protein